MKLVIGLVFTVTITSLNSVHPEDQSSSKDAMEDPAATSSPLFGNGSFPTVNIDDIDLDKLFGNDSHDECDKWCLMDNVPVCGSDGVTYNTECEFSIAQCKAAKNSVLLQIKRSGEYISVDPSAAASSDCTSGPFFFAAYRPTCGTNIVTYTNECDFYVAYCKAVYHGDELSTLHDGECSLSDSSSSTKDSVTGSGTKTEDHQTSANFAVLDEPTAVRKPIRLLLPPPRPRR